MTNSMKQLASWFWLFFISWSILFLSLLSTSTFAGEQIDQTLDFIKDGNITISNHAGKIAVTGWEKNQVHVIGILNHPDGEFIFERHGNNINIEIPENPYGKGTGDHLKILIPTKSNVRFESPNTEFSISKQIGSLNVEALNGNIFIEKVEGRVRAEVVNGSIQCKNVKGRVSIETVNGNIGAQGVTSGNGTFSAVNGNINIRGDVLNAKLETVSGAVHLQLGKVENLQLETVAGDIEIEAELVENGDLRASSVSGNISLIFLKMPSAHFKVVNHTGGTVTNNLSADTAVKNDFGPGKHLNFSHEGGKASVSLSTLHGNVVIDSK